jgi:hypothetical protein
MSDCTTLSDALERLMNNVRLLDQLNHMPDRDTSPIWLMVYAKCAADIDYIIDSGQDMWTDAEEEYILGVHTDLVEWGRGALDET